MYNQEKPSFFIFVVVKVRFMNEDQNSQVPISVVHYGLGKEIKLYKDALVVTAHEEGHELHVPLEDIQRLILTPGDPTPSKLVLTADLVDGTSTVLAEGMTNARGFRAMLPQITELRPEIELDPPDMAEQLRQALNNKRAWSLTCYGAIFLLCGFLYLLYFIVVYIGAHH